MNLTVICAMTWHVSIAAVSAVESKKEWAITDVACFYCSGVGRGEQEGMGDH